MKRTHPFLVRRVFVLSTRVNTRMTSSARITIASNAHMAPCSLNRDLARRHTDNDGLVGELETRGGGGGQWYWLKAGGGGQMARAAAAASAAVADGGSISTEIMVSTECVGKDTCRPGSASERECRD